MRKFSYYKYAVKNKLSIKFLLKTYYSVKFQKISQKMGFTIGEDCLGYGAVIPHWGTIVINSRVRIGNYAVLHTSTCIAGGNKTIGNGLYLSTGSIIVGALTLGDNVSIASNSLVNKSFGNNMLLAGTPANIKKTDYMPWYERDGELFKNRVMQVEKLKQIMLTYN